MKSLQIFINGQPYSVEIETLKEYGEGSKTKTQPRKSRPQVAPAPIPTAAPSTAVASAPVAQATSAKDLVSPMQGTVYKVKTTVGTEVQEGETLVILEAMKMETPVKSNTAGVVKSIEINEGDVVSEGQLLVIIE